MEEIINNIMQTPDNTNPNVLRSQLQGMANGGSGGGILVVTGVAEDHGEVTTIVLDKTWQEINDAVFAILKQGEDSHKSIYVLKEVGSSPVDYSVVFSAGVDELEGVTNSTQGYPVITIQADGTLE